jgi:hypothetical protein
MNKSIMRPLVYSALLALALSCRFVSASTAPWRRGSGPKGRNVSLDTPASEGGVLERRLQARSILNNLFARMSVKQSNKANRRRMMMMRMMRGRMMMTMMAPALGAMTATPTRLRGPDAPASPGMAPVPMTRPSLPDIPDTMRPTAPTCPIRDPVPVTLTTPTRPSLADVPDTMRPIAPARPVASKTTRTPTRQPLSPPSVGTSCAVKTNITCSVRGVDCSAFNWTDFCETCADSCTSSCYDADFGCYNTSLGVTVKYILENSGTTPMSIQAVDIMEPRLTPPNKTDFLPYLAKNPLGPGQTNAIQLERVMDSCNHANANFTVTVQSTAPGGTPCSSTFMYTLQDLLW